MTMYVLIQMIQFFMLIHASSTISSYKNQDNSEIDSTLTVPGTFCHFMQDTSRLQLDYPVLRDNCENIDNKKKTMKLATTFDGIERRLFEELPQFEKLDATYLNFTEISLSSSNLKSIDFSKNKLKTFRIFVNESLKILSVSHNKLMDIELLLNEEKCNLQILDISHNNLSTVDAISNLSNLLFLNLMNNNMEYLGNNVFVKLKKLVDLNLSWNKLSYLQTSTFSSCQNLVSLDLSNNNLENVDGSLEPLKNLKYLNLDGNKLLKFDYEGLFQRHPSLEKFKINCDLVLNEYRSQKIDMHFSSDKNTCRFLKKKNFKRRSVSNSHFHVAINNKKLYHNVTSILKNQNKVKLVNESDKIPLKDFFEKLHDLNVENVRNFLNVTFEKVDSRVDQLEYKYVKIMKKLDSISSKLDSKLEELNETLSDIVLEISNLDTENSDVHNMTLDDIVSKTSFILNDYEDIEFLLRVCFALMLILVFIAIFWTFMRLRSIRHFKKYRINLLNLETAS